MKIHTHGPNRAIEGGLICRVKEIKTRDYRLRPTASSFRRDDRGVVVRDAVGRSQPTTADSRSPVLFIYLRIE